MRKKGQGIEENVIKTECGAQFDQNGTAQGENVSDSPTKSDTVWSIYREISASGQEAAAVKMLSDEEWEETWDEIAFAHTKISKFLENDGLFNRERRQHSTEFKQVYDMAINMAAGLEKLLLDTENREKPEKEGQGIQEGQVEAYE